MYKIKKLAKFINSKLKVLTSLCKRHKKRDMLLKKEPKITRVFELTADSDERKRCDLCRQRIKHGDLVFPFENKEICEMSDIGGDARMFYREDIIALNYSCRMNLLEHFVRIQKQFEFDICQRCFEKLTKVRVIHKHNRGDWEKCKVGYKKSGAW